MSPEVEKLITRLRSDRHLAQGDGYGALLETAREAADLSSRLEVTKALLVRARWYVADALDAHEHTDGRDLLKEIDAALAQEGEG